MCAGIWGVGANVRPLMRTSMSCAVRVEELRLCIVYVVSCLVCLGLKNDRVSSVSWLEVVG